MLKTIFMEFILLIGMPIGLILIMKYVSNKLANTLFRKWNKFLLISTIVHELSHYLIAKLFLLKINKVSLFKPDFQTGVLGQVDYSYNENSMKDRIGASLSGLAPVIIIVTILSLLYSNWFNIADLINLTHNFSIWSFIKSMFGLIFPNGKFIHILLFYLIFFILSPGLSLSDADLRSATVGAGSLITIFFIVCFVGTVYFNWPTPALFKLAILLNSILAFTILIELILFGLLNLIDFIRDMRD